MSLENNKKWWPLIVGLIVLLLFASVSVSTGQSSTDVQQFQQGFGSCIPSVVGQTPAFVCTIPVTFSPAFAAVPNHIDLTWTGIQQPQGHYETPGISAGSVTFQSDNGETWINFPAAKTEIYGTMTHEASAGFVLGNTPVLAAFSAYCATASSSATAVLRPEYSIDGGSAGTWHELSANPGGLDVSVGSGSSCAFGSQSQTVGPFGIQANFTSNAGGQLRVVGINGGGVGDNVLFNNLQLMFFINYSQLITLCVFESGTGNGIQCANGGNPLSKTGMTILVTEWTPPISAARIGVDWSARLCINGGTAC